MAVTTYTWTSTSGGVWTSAAHWSAASAPPTAGAAAESALIDINVATTGGPITLFASGGGTILAGGISITANATLDVASGQVLEAGSPGATAGAVLAVNAGTVDLSGGTLDYVTYRVGSVAAGPGTIEGFGTIADSYAANGTISTSNGGTVIATGGTLLVMGDASNHLLTGSGSFGIAGGAVLQFGSFAAIGAGAIVNFATAAGDLNVVNATSAFSSGNTLLATLDNLLVGTVTNSSANASEITFATGSGVAVSSASIVNNATLQVITSGGTYHFDSNGSFSGDHVDWSTAGGATTIWVDTQPCYAAGTRILTDRGEVAVEELAAGDMVVTLAGDRREPRPIKWIGNRHLNLKQHPQPNLVAPVRIRQHAFGTDLPARDLLVSPDHCLFVDGTLVPAKLLINDMTIGQELATAAIHYYHVELDRHAVMLAEGLAAESYLDTGNRAMFANAGLALVLHPDCSVNAGLKCWETDACAPLTVAQEAVKPIWRRLLDRAVMLGHRRPELPTTTDPELQLVVDGRALQPIATHGHCHVFALPAGVSAVRLMSRSGVPSAFEPYLDDWRKLGVAIRRILVRDAAGITDIPMDHPGLGDGWHAVERDDATMWRWMNGNAVLALPETAGLATLEVHVGMTMRFAAEDHAAAERDRLAA